MFARLKERVRHLRAEAQAMATDGKPTSRIASIVIIGIWIFIAALLVLWVMDKVWS